MRLSVVDGTSPSVRALLLKLQQTILPLDKALDPRLGHWWLGYVDGKPVAFGCLNLSRSFIATGYMSRSGVVLAHRGKGYQKKLIRARVQKAKSFGWTHVISDTYNNPQSANSLISCGFKSYIPSYEWGADGTAYWIRRC